jgi:TIR domain/Caspase domain
MDAEERHALLIGGARFDDTRLGTLPSAADDVQQLAAVLGDSALGGFRIETLVDETCRTIQVAIARLCLQARKNDVVVVYYSGHGVVDHDGQLYFAARDTEVDVVRATAPSSAFVIACMRGSRSRSKVLILDASHSGAVLRDVPAPDHVMIMTASDALEYAFEDSHGRVSIFTRQLVNGLASGDADLDGDGIVTFEEVFAFARTRIHASSTGATGARPRLLNLTDAPIMAARSPKHIFISYAREDAGFVGSLTEGLQECGHRTWVDVVGIAGGADWRNRVASAIDGAKALLCILSPESLSSDWVRRELDYADSIHTPVLPLVAREAALPPWYVLAFGHLQRLDYTDTSRRPDAVREVDAAIRDRVAEAQAAVATHLR